MLEDFYDQLVCAKKGDSLVAVCLVKHILITIEVVGIKEMKSLRLLNSITSNVQCLVEKNMIYHVFVSIEYRSVSFKHFSSSTYIINFISSTVVHRHEVQIAIIFC